MAQAEEGSGRPEDSWRRQGGTRLARGRRDGCDPGDRAEALAAVARVDRFGAGVHVAFGPEIQGHPDDGEGCVRQAEAIQEAEGAIGLTVEDEPECRGPGGDDQGRCRPPADPADWIEPGGLLDGERSAMPSIYRISRSGQEP